MTMAMTTTTTMTTPTTHSAVRTLRDDELDEVAGGFNPFSGAFGAGLGGVIGGAKYAVNTTGSGTFSWGGFAEVTLRTAVSGFLIGSGSSLLFAAATGVARGSAVLGASMVGAGASLEVASGAPGTGGGSERE